MGSLMAILSGILMSINGLWNTRVTEKAGVWFTNVFAHIIGLIFALIMLLIVRDANLEGIKAVNKFYLFSGIIGAGIVYTVIISIGRLGPAGATMLILISQIIASYVIEVFGLFDTDKAPFQWSKVIAVAFMIIGILIFKIDK